MGEQFNDALNLTLEQLFLSNSDFMRGSNILRMCSHEHNHVYGSAHIFNGFFGYSTSFRHEPRLMFFNDISLHEFISKKEYINENGHTELCREMCSVEELSNVKNLDQLYNLLEEEKFTSKELVTGLNDIERSYDYIRKERGAIFLHDLSTFKKYNPLKGIKEIDHQLLVEVLTNNPNRIHPEYLIKGSNYYYKTPPYRDYSYDNFVAIIEKVEMYYTNSMKSQSPSELYYKTDLRDNLILKNGGETLIQNILNYNQYVTENLHDKIEQNLLGILYKVQEVRESMAKNIVGSNVKHYTPAEFATLFTEALINISYGVGMPSPDDGESIYMDLGYYSHGMDETNPHDIYDRKGNFLGKSKHFLLDFDKLKVLENYVNTNFPNHEELNHMKNTLERCRSMLVHDYIKDAFYEELYTKNEVQQELEYEDFFLRWPYTIN